MKAQRVDVGTLRPATRRPDGTVVCDGYLTRCGVFEYQQPDGSIRRELRPRTEVADPASLATLEGRPVTDDHPSHMLSADDASTFARGAVAAGAKMDGDHVVSRLSAWDGNLVRKMNNGTQQLSCGYECDLDETPGIDPQYGRYDAVQRNIKYNHVAVLDHGRAGTARVRMDGVGVQVGDLVTPHGHATITPVKVARTDMQQPSATAVVDPNDEANRSGRGANDAPVTDAMGAGVMNRPNAGRTTEGPDEGEPGEDDDCMDAYDTSYVDGELTQAARDKIKASNFAVPDKEKLPIHDPPHVRAAMSRFGQTDFESADEKHGAFNRIVKKAKQLGVSSKGFEKAHANKLDRLDRDPTQGPTMTDADKKAEQYKTERDAEKARADRLDGEMASLRKDLEALKGAPAPAPVPHADAAFEQRVAGRVDLMTKVNAILGATDAKGQPVDRTKMSDRDIKLAVVKHVDHDDVPGDKPDAYVDAMFDGAVRRFNVGAQGQYGARASIEAARVDSGSTIVPPGSPAAREDAEDAGLTDEKSARGRNRERSGNAWQTRIDTATYKTDLTGKKE